MRAVRIDGAALRRARLTRGLTQHELAEGAGISRATVARLEKGWAGGVLPATLRRLADTLGVDTERLIDWDASEDRPKARAAA